MSGACFVWEALCLNTRELWWSLGEYRCHPISLIIHAPLLLALAACPVSELPFLTIDILLHPVPSHPMPHPRSSCFGITIYRAIPYHVTQTESSTIFNIFFPSAACFLCLQRWSKLHSWRRWARSTSKTKTLQAEPNLPIPFKYVGWNVSFQTNHLEFVEVCHRFVVPGVNCP